MRKTVTITISGALFHIEEAAYAALDTYLNAIRAHFASYPDSDEIVSDIEGRVAEEFSEKLKGRKKVISEQDVEELIHNMGTIKDFEAFESGDGAEKQEKETWRSHAGKRLYRDGDDQMLGGVCSGIAKYFGIDPTLIRLAFALSIFLGGSGIFVYIILWIILPEAKTQTEKVEMAQGKVTLKALQERIDATVPREKRRTMVRKTLSFPGLVIRAFLKAISKVLRVVVPILARLVGAALSIGMALAVAGLTVIMLMLLTNPASPYIDFPLYATIGAMNYFLLVISAYFLALVPVLFILLIGASLLSLRNTFSTLGIASLVGLWLIALTVGTVTGFSVAPAIEAAAKRYEQEHFAMTEKILSLKDFDRIETGGNTQLTITQAPTFSVTVRASEQDWAGVHATVEEKKLFIGRNGMRRHCFFFCHDSGLSAVITMPTLTHVDVSGVSQAIVKGFDEKGDVTLDASGHSFIDALLHAQTVTANANGVSTIRLRGGAQTLGVALSGASSLHAFDFPTETATLELSGVSRAWVNASKSLTGEASGNSTVFYNTVPPGLEFETSGVSRMEQADRDQEEDEQW